MNCPARINHETERDMKFTRPTNICYESEDCPISWLPAEILDVILTQACPIIHIGTKTSFPSPGTLIVIRHVCKTWAIAITPTLLKLNRGRHLNSIRDFCPMEFAGRGYKTLLKWIITTYNKTPHWNNIKTIGGMASHGWLNLIRFTIEIVDEFPKSIDPRIIGEILVRASAKCHLNILNYIRKVAPVIPFTNLHRGIQMAAKFGCLGVLIWFDDQLSSGWKYSFESHNLFKTQKAGTVLCGKGKIVTKTAAYWGHGHILGWLRRVGAYNHWEAVMSAMRGNRLELFIELMQHTDPKKYSIGLGEIVVDAINTGKIDHARFLLTSMNIDKSRAVSEYKSVMSLKNTAETKTLKQNWSSVGNLIIQSSRWTRV